jgi:hypothetical protein
VLPSTNQSLRELTLLRGNRSYSSQNDRPITFETEYAFTQLIEHEIKFAQRKETIKRNLLKRGDFTKKNAFNEIAKNENEISLENLVSFLDN